MPEHPYHLRWRQVSVDGRVATYGEAGEGAPLVFLHGWGIGYRSYKRALRRLVEQGWRVVAPGLPGLSGTADLPHQEYSLEGYARWVVRFLRTVEVEEPAVLVGHSFGGGVALKVAHDHPPVVSRLVLVNSIGGSAWRRGSTLRSMADRPLWDWGLHFPADLLPVRQATRVLPVILEDALPNLVRNPRGVIRAAGVARFADLRSELEELRRRGLPVVVLWGENDRIIPAEAMQSLTEALGVDCVTVPGRHGWLLADPVQFAEVMTNVLEVARAAEQAADQRDGERRSGRPRLGPHLRRPA